MKQRCVVSDDIVTRLRQAYKDADEVASVFLTNEAANEIEYLRSEMANVNSEYNKLWRKYEQALKDNSTLIHVCQDCEGRLVRGE